MCLNFVVICYSLDLVTIPEGVDGLRQFGLEKSVNSTNSGYILQVLTYVSKLFDCNYLTLKTQVYLVIKGCNNSAMAINHL